MNDEVRHKTQHLITSLEGALQAARDLHAALSVVAPPPLPPPVKRPPLLGKAKVMAAPPGLENIELLSRAQLKDACIQAGHSKEAVNGKTVDELRKLLA